MTSINATLILLITSLVAAAFAGLALLKAYQEFRKGVEQNSNLRIWSAFFIVAFLFILITFSIARG